MFGAASTMLVKRAHRGSSSSVAWCCVQPLQIGWKDEKNDDTATQHRHQRRDYHATPRHDMVLYGTIILVAGIGYVGYKTYRGEPLKPINATKAQEEYRRLEEERDRRNKEHQQKFHQQPQNSQRRK